MAKLTKEIFIESLKEMNIKEVMELVEAMKQEFGVDPSAVAVAAAPADGGGATEEKSEFNIVLKTPGGNKVAIIKAVKEITGAGLMDAKKMVESTPVTVKENVKKEDAEELKTKLEATGAEVELA